MFSCGQYVFPLGDFLLFYVYFVSLRTLRFFCVVQCLILFIFSLVYIAHGEKALFSILSMYLPT